MSDQVSLSCSSEFVAYACGQAHVGWSVVSLKAPLYEPSTRAAVDVVAVIDKSGSMAGEKLTLVKKTLEFVISQLKECDRLGLVTYDTGVYLDFGLMKMTSKNKERATHIVKQIQDGSSTNLSGGLIKGMVEILDRGKDKNPVASVLLLTDGHANAGITRKEDIVRAMRNPKKYMDYQSHSRPMLFPSLFQSNVAPTFIPQQQQQQLAPQMQQLLPQIQQIQPSQVAVPPVPQLQQQVPDLQAAAAASLPPPGPPATQNVFNQGPPMVPPPPPPHQFFQQAEESQLPEDDDDSDAPPFEGSVYTFGFGSDHDAAMLKAISDAGHGVYYFVDSVDKIPESFADCLGGLLSVVGQNIALTVEMGPECTIKKIHGRQSRKLAEDKKKCQFQLGDMQSEEQRDLVIEVNLPSLPSPSEEPQAVLTTSVTYFNVITSIMDAATVQLVVDRPEAASNEPCDANVDVDRQRNRITVAAALETATSLADAGNFDAARKAVSDSRTIVETSKTASEDFCKALTKDMQDCLEGLLSHSSYSTFGQQQMYSRAQSHEIQRSNFVDSPTYGSSSKAAMQMQAKAFKPPSKK